MIKKSAAGRIIFPAADFLLRLFIIAIYAPRKTTLPGVCSPVEAGEVARVSATKRGRPA